MLHQQQLLTLVSPSRCNHAAQPARCKDASTGREGRGGGRGGSQGREDDPIRTVRGAGYSFDERFGAR